MGQLLALPVHTHVLLLLSPAIEDDLAEVADHGVSQDVPGHEPIEAEFHSYDDLAVEGGDLAEELNGNGGILGDVPDADLGEDANSGLFGGLEEVRQNGIPWSHKARKASFLVISHLVPSFVFLANFLFGELPDFVLLNFHNPLFGLDNGFEGRRDPAYVTPRVLFHMSTHFQPIWSRAVGRQLKTNTLERTNSNKRKDFAGNVIFFLSPFCRVPQ